MPEGDSIARIATRLAPALVGKRLERVTTQGLARAIAGRRVTSVTSHGKHLVIELDEAAHAVRVHLGMYGRQRSYDREEGERVLARTSPGRVSLALVTEDAVHLWLGAKTVELADRRAPRAGQALAALGPDVLADDFDPSAAATRAQAQPGRAIADVLLDQRVAAGIGNVYKSEVLFVRGVDPRTPISALSHEALAALFEVARELMVANLGPGPRSTTRALAGERPDRERYFVYSRGGRLCRRCQRSIRGDQLGDPPRWTWWCEGCQSQGGDGR